jgi:cytochrome c553
VVERVEPTEEAATTAQASWVAVSGDGLTARQQAQLELAEKARGTMGQRLMGRVMEAAETSGFDGAIEVCKTEAGPIAKTVASEFDVAIGRTSLKLRNPDNTAPDWAGAHVDSELESRALVQGPDGELGVLLPIHLAAPCLNCHGETAQLADGVAESLARLYPDDEATGFAKGDLRGWFWVEVPAGSVEVDDSLAGVVTVARNGAASSPGEAAYVTYCAACHGREGQGVIGQFPPLVGTPRVLGHPDALIALTLDGIKGPLEVDGVKYSGFMPGQAHLGDETIAQLLTHMRVSWGNDAAPIEIDAVRRLREQTASRADAWTQRELEEQFVEDAQP